MMDRQQARKGDDDVSEIWGFQGFNGTIFQVSKYMVLGWIEMAGILKCYFFQQVG